MQITSVTILSYGEQVAYVATKRGNYVVGSLPTGNELDVDTIIKRVKDIEEAQLYFRRAYGLEEKGE